jgi:flagellar motor switch protein FliG
MPDDQTILDDASSGGGAPKPPARPSRVVSRPAARGARRNEKGDAKKASVEKDEKAEPKEKPALTGPQKAAIIFLCLDEETSGEMMKRLDDFQVRKITRALANLGRVSVETIEAVITEFSMSVQSGGQVVGTLRVAEKLLRSFLPEDKVTEILNDLRGPVREHDLWQRLGSVNENTIANYLKGEHDQTVAAILSNLNPDVVVRVLPLLGRERMDEVLERMIRLDAILPVTLQQIEQTLQADIMSGGERRTSVTEIQQRMAGLFNKLDRALFEEVSKTLEERIPDEFQAIRQRMFTFEDLIKIDQRSIAVIIQGVEGNTLPLALRGASKELREHFLGALPTRAREMLVEEMNTMGPVRGRDVRNAQGEIVDHTRDLAEQEVIYLPTGDEGDALM